jgi:hypothetical protein
LALQLCVMLQDQIGLKAAAAHMQQHLLLLPLLLLACPGCMRSSRRSIIGS